MTNGLEKKKIASSNHLSISFHVNIDHLSPGDIEDSQRVFLRLIKQVLKGRLEGAVDPTADLMATANVTVAAHHNVSRIDHL